MFFSSKQRHGNFKGSNNLIKKRGMSILSLKYLERQIKYLTIYKYLVRDAGIGAKHLTTVKNSFLRDCFQNYKDLQIKKLRSTDQ